MAKAQVSLPIGDAQPTEIGPLVARARKRKLVFTIPHDPSAPVAVATGVDAGAMWSWMREHLINNLELAAKMTGIPELVRLRYLPLPKAPIKLLHLLGLYEAHSDASKRSKSFARGTFEDFIRITEAKTLDGLTTERLKVYRDGRPVALTIVGIVPKRARSRSSSTTSKLSRMQRCS